ncbi:LytR/AlgR family response regulator transcription factor [Flagellimonas meridianipacifica]|uniref:DNA-binding LytR/AlgR family response regulator n=1 Tax=Flagellimonas meridianipacifica TaxID=1080225 RepID=A0A2T0MHK1_9FLAO|nr:LytTR family DNA-binding domain-containing protein [Allomuricauda pacifica]PRX57035.1 DNA-binding LytR/AlgR family response regulator [Allomuricauda pacifica]
MKAKVIIVEDEPKAQKHLENLLGLSGFDIVVEARLSSVESAVKWLEENSHPDILFLDIHLSDGISFEIMEKTSLEAPIIFTTAYDEYAIKAFKTTGIDYLLKPLTHKDVNEALVKFFRTKNQYFKEWMAKSMELKKYFPNTASHSNKDRFLLRSGNEMLPFHVDEIAYFFRSEIVFAKTYEGSQFSINTSLNQLETALDPNKFVRLNRQLLTNIEAIAKIKPGKGGQLLVELNPQYHETVIVSQERASWLKNLLGQI